MGQSLAVLSINVEYGMLFITFIILPFRIAISRLVMVSSRPAYLSVIRMQRRPAIERRTRSMMMRARMHKITKTILLK